MSTGLELSLYNARSRRHSVALTRIEHFEHFEGSLGVRDLGGGRGCQQGVVDGHGHRPAQLLREAPVPDL